MAFLITSHEFWEAHLNPTAMVQFSTILIMGPQLGFNTTGTEAANSNVAFKQSAILGLPRFASQVFFIFATSPSIAADEVEKASPVHLFSRLAAYLKLLNAEFRRLSYRLDSQICYKFL